MGCCNGEGTPVNSFALVSYLPQPLAGFLDRLRGELVQECYAKAHVTVLPPRPLTCSPDEAWGMLQERLRNFKPFLVELGPVEIFPVTQVVYISVKAGHSELKQLHETLNAGRLAVEEPFSYHPHITLAQDLDPSQVAPAFEKAILRWREFSGSRSFMVDRLTFVQNTLENRWTDLSGCPLVSTVTL
jgi:2'-5' RNA ligase